MAREIIWTPEAKEDFRDIVAYLINQFGDEVATNYTGKLFNTLETLLKMPYIGRTHSEFSGVRQQLVRPYTKICYVVLPDFLVIVNLTDSRSSTNRR